MLECKGKQHVKYIYILDFQGSVGESRNPCEFQDRVNPKVKGLLSHRN